MMKVNTQTLRLNKLNEVLKCLERLTTFLTPALPFINAHNVDFFVKSYWDTYLPHNIKIDAEQNRTNLETLKSHLDNLCSRSHTWRKDDNVFQDDITFSNCDLETLVHKIGEFGLDTMKMSTTIEEISMLKSDTTNIQIDLGITEADLKFDQFMSAKKMHEVEAMSYLIHRAAKAVTRSSSPQNGSTAADGFPDPEADKLPPNQNVDSNQVNIVNNLIDVGSGKGYMSSFLALLYNFKVLALDASPGNTSASQERAARLRKSWYHLLRRASERAKTGECLSSRGKAWKSQELPNSQNVTESSTNNSCAVKTKMGTSCEIGEICENLTNLNMVVHKAVNLDTLLQKAQNEKMAEHEQFFGIVGLHTCGGLGVDSINLFLDHENARFLCNVPCCYHHLEEMIFPTTVSEINSPYSWFRQKKEGANFWAAEDSALIPQPTFPVSSFLQRKNFNLGRNARMLSSYSHQRIREEIEETQGVDIYLIWRLLLQVIIKEKQGHTLLEHQVGKIGRRCATFEDYVRKAMKKLHLEHIQVCTEEINEVYKRHEPLFQYFQFYYVIRTMLAPLLEACILLDRLAYLLEQDQIEDAFIVEIFNELTSPRRHAILAFKTAWDNAIISI